MATLASLTVNLEANTASYERNMRRSSKVLTAFSGQVAKFAGLAGAGFGLVKATKFIIDANREYERLNAQLITVTGSQEAASAAFDQLEQFAKTTPFQIEENVQAFIRLKAVGIEPTAERMRAFGDISSGMGRRITDFARAVQGAVTGEFESLKSFGIVARAQGENVALTFKGVTTTVKRNANEITDALQRIGETGFAGAMENEMNTLNGIISNIQDNFGIMARQLGEVLRPVMVDVAGKFRDFAGTIAENREGLIVFSRVLVALANIVSDIVITPFTVLGNLLGNIGNILVGVFTRDFGRIKTAVTEIMGDIVGEFKDGADNIAALFRAVTDPIPERLKSNTAPAVAAVANQVNGLASAAKKAGESMNFLASAELVQRAGRLADFIFRARDAFEKITMFNPFAGGKAPIVEGAEDMAKQVEQQGIAAGEGLIRGFITGSDNLLGQLKNAMLNIASSIIIGTLKTKLGIASPSKVTQEMGKNLVQGFQRGVEGAKSMMTAALGDSVTLPAAQVGGGGGAGDGGLTVNVDLTVNTLDTRSMAEWAFGNRHLLASAVAQGVNESDAIRAYMTRRG